MKKFILIFFLMTSIYCNEIIYLLTIPKCGTHCLEKYFQLLNYIGKSPKYTLRSCHLSESYLNLPKSYFENEDVKKIILKRDLRDMFLSALHYVCTFKHWLQSNVSFSPGWNNLSDEEKLLELINYEQEPQHIIWKYKNRTLPQQIKKTVGKAIELSKKPNTLVVNFEDLSGNNGINSQLIQMRKINSFVDIELSEEEEIFLVENIFGNKLISTGIFFVDGKSNKWKNTMPSWLSEKFKYYYGDDLIMLEYENDLDW